MFAALALFREAVRCWRVANTQPALATRTFSIIHLT